MDDVNKEKPITFIQGIGVDLVDLSRLDLSNQHFIEHILSSQEFQIFHTLNSEKRQREFLGGRFAGKEAVLKALGTGLGGMRFKDIEILNLESGQPYLNIPGSYISISHDGNMAIAFVVLTGNQKI